MLSPSFTDSWDDCGEKQRMEDNWFNRIDFVHVEGDDQPSPEYTVTSTCDNCMVEVRERIIFLEQRLKELWNEVHA